MSREFVSSVVLVLLWRRKCIEGEGRGRKEERGERGGGGGAVAGGGREVVGREEFFFLSSQYEYDSGRDTQ